MITSKIGNLSFDRYTECAVTLVRNANDSTCIVIESFDSNGQNLKFRIAEFAEKKFHFKNHEEIESERLKVINVETTESKYNLKFKSQSPTWRLKNHNVKVVWNSIEEEEWNSIEKDKNKRQFYYMEENSTSKEDFYHTFDPVLIKIRNADLNLFKKLYKQAKDISSLEPLQLIQEVTKKNPHWRTLEKLETVYLSKRKSNGGLDYIREQYFKIILEIKNANVRWETETFDKLEELRKAQNHPVAYFHSEYFKIVARMITNDRNRATIEKLEKLYKEDPNVEYLKIIVECMKSTVTCNMFEKLEKLYAEDPNAYYILFIMEMKLANPSNWTPMAFVKFKKLYENDPCVKYLTKIQENEKNIYSIRKQLEKLYQEKKMQDSNKEDLDFVNLEIEAMNIEQEKGIHEMYENWAYNAASYAISNPPSLRIFSIWIRIYQRIKQSHIKIVKFTPYNNHSWAIEKVKKMGVEIKEGSWDNLCINKEKITRKSIPY